MQRKISVTLLIVIVAVSVLLTYSLTSLDLNRKYNRKLNDVLTSHSAYYKADEIRDLIGQYFIGDADEKRMEEYALDGLIAGLGDKYAVYLTADEFRARELESAGQLVGIGTQVVWNDDAELLEIVDVFPDSPAQKAGVEPGDLINMIGEKSVSDLGYDEAVRVIRGEAGTEVSFTVIRGETEQIGFTVARAAVSTPSVYFHFFRDEKGNDTKIGVIRISGFDSTTPEQFSEALRQLTEGGAEGVVYDLRNNPGGELNSVTSILDLLLPEGPIVRLYDKAKNETTISSDQEFLDMKAVVLINGNSASAAELFTSALRDYAKKDLIDVTVMGTKTYGKGTAQTIFRLSDNSAISISTKTYDPPFSDNYEGIGIKPDITVEQTEEARKINFYKLTDANDNQLIEAVHCLLGK